MAERLILAVAVVLIDTAVFVVPLAPGSSSHTLSWRARRGSGNGSRHSTRSRSVELRTRLTHS